MKKNNVPFGVPPVCSEPSRLSGKSWDDLQQEDFACLPKVQSSSMGMVKVSKVIEGENATLNCRLQATPDTQVRKKYFKKMQQFKLKRHNKLIQLLLLGLSHFLNLS